MNIFAQDDVYIKTGTAAGTLTGSTTGGVSLGGYTNPSTNADIRLYAGRHLYLRANDGGTMSSNTAAVIIGDSSTISLHKSIAKSTQLDDYNYIFDGKILLNDFLKIVKVDLDFFDHIKGESDSLAGLILEIEGRIPKIGTICNIPPFTIVVESADFRRIKRLKVTVNES